LDRSSTIGRLLEIISWQGRSVRQYRDRGRGMEDVLTAEVFQALDFLPRARCLAAVLGSSSGEASAARAILVDEAESLRVGAFGDRFYLNPSATNHQARIAVDPDATIECSEIFCLVEAKRIRAGASFQREQLAREYFVLTREAGERETCLLLVLPAHPPVKIKGIQERLRPADVIRRTLPEVYAKAEPHPRALDELLVNAERYLLWITWHEIAEIVSREAKEFSTGDRSVDACVRRLARTVSASVGRHSSF